tara:strand:+ start:353 stop:706 length:354 start_codon:yes stop_codon:yes gene_type:complete
MHFCSECHNLTFIHTNEDKKLIHYCKTCNKVEDYEEDGCVFSQSFNEIDKSEIINSNKYINHDITLPSINNNPNLKCPNSNCESHTQGETEIKYIKHDYKNMKYTYICNSCGQKWSN